MQRPPEDDDPTSEEEVPEFDGTHTDQLDDKYRSRIAAGSERPHGAVGFDDRGQAQWKWITEIEPDGSATGTFDQLKALENPALTLEEEPAPDPPRKTGYDPYATEATLAKPKLRR